MSAEKTITDEDIQEGSETELIDFTEPDLSTTFLLDDEVELTVFLISPFYTFRPVGHQLLT